MMRMISRVLSLRSRRVFCTVAAFSLAVSIIGTLTISHREAAVTQAAGAMDFVSVCIDAGDTLNSIYTEYRDMTSLRRDEFIDRVVYINGLGSADSIHADAYIVIPVDISLT